MFKTVEEVRAFKGRQSYREWMAKNEAEMLEILRRHEFVIADRRTGKTTALLNYVFEQVSGYRNSYAIVCANGDLASMVRIMWQEGAYGGSQNKPLFVSSPEQIRGMDVKLVADEIFLLNRRVWRDFRFECGVGSVERQIVSVREIW